MPLSRIIHRTRSALHGILVGALVAQTAGCMPAFRKPKHVDLFRAAPMHYEKRGPLEVRPQHGLPLPQIPPVTSGTERVPPDCNAEPQELPLTLDEVIRIGLSNSGVVRILDGGVSASPLTPFDPEIAEARARMALAAFDPTVSASAYSNWINLPPEAVFGPGLAEPTLRDEVNFAATVRKPWMTGTETTIAYNPPLGYLFIPDYDGSSFNPLYTSNTEFIVKQSLLKGGSIRANRAPLRIAQIRRDQTAVETRGAVMASVRSLTEGYWDLYAARNAAYAVEQVVPLLERVAKIEEERMAAERSVRADVAKAYSQLRAVRQQAVQARSAVVQRELRLRNLMGVPPYDGYVIIPTSRPLEAPVTVDAAQSTALAEGNRPELISRQMAVRAREAELLAARNAGLPQLDATGVYRMNGVGGELEDSLSQMYGNVYHDWQAALTFTMPLGRRAAAANIRAATLQLARERALMQQALHATTHQINALIQEAAYTHQLFIEAEARLKANTDWLEGAKIRYENPPPAGDGNDWLLAATNDYLSALRGQADAASDAQSFLSRYNGLLARLNETTGTILNDFEIRLSGDDADVTGATIRMPLQPTAIQTPPMVETVPMPAAGPARFGPSPDAPTINPLSL